MPNCATLGCVLPLAKEEAKRAIKVLVGSAGAEVGYAPFNHCYQPDPNYPPFTSPTQCIPTEWIVSPASSETELNAAIDATTNYNPNIGAGANLCLGLLQAQQLLERNSSRIQNIIILTLGDNNFLYTSYFQSIEYPPDPCRPTLAVSQQQPAPPLCGPIP